MPYEFVRFGEAPFPGAANIRCSRFEWRSTTPDKHGHFKIPFLSPDNEPGPRRYWIEPLLKKWTLGTATRFLESACAYGANIVAELDNHTAEERDAYRMANLVFRNRGAGDVEIDRIFMQAEDFVDFSDPEQLTLITPGINAEDLDNTGHTQTLRARARQLLDRGFRNLDPPLVGGPLNFRGVVDAYERLARQSAETIGSVNAPSPAPGINDTDSLFIQRLCGNADFREIENQVAGALVYGPALLADDQRKTEEDPDAWRFFVSQVARQATARDTSGPRFDAWLRRVREGGYRQLIRGGHHLRGRNRKAAVVLAQSFFRRLLWLSYRMMAHCYGALIFLVTIAFDDQSDHRPSTLERLLFRLHHQQVDFLAGLPLDFLERAPLRWIIGILDHLEGMLRHPDFGDLSSRGEFRPEMYREVSQMLGVFAVLVRNRREADRRAKARRAVPRREYNRDLEDVSKADGRPVNRDAVAADDQHASDPIELISLACPICQTRLTDAEAEDVSHSDRAVFWAYCRHCDRRDRFIANLLVLRSRLVRPS